MNLETLGLYLLAVVIVIAVPGPLSLFMVGNALQFGVWRSWPGVVGGVLASVSLLLLSALGIGALLLASPRLFMLLQLLGAVYLLYLGWRSWQGRTMAAGFPGQGGPDRGYLFSKAFLLGVSNPKDIVFFLALLPQFLNPAQALLPQLWWMAAGWMVVDFLCKLSYGLLASRLLRSMAAMRRIFLMVAAGCFWIMGAGLLVEVLAGAVR